MSNHRASHWDPFYAKNLLETAVQSNSHLLHRRFSPVSGRQYKGKQALAIKKNKTPFIIQPHFYTHWPGIAIPVGKRNGNSQAFQ